MRLLAEMKVWRECVLGQMDEQVAEMRRIWSGEATKVLGHATSGPALQQNLVCVMEGR